MYYRRKIIEEIEAADDDEQVGKIVDNSVKTYKNKVSDQVVRKFSLNMVTDLQSLIVGQGLPSKAKENVIVAIRMFRAQYRQCGPNTKGL